MSWELLDSAHLHPPWEMVSMIELVLLLRQLLVLLNNAATKWWMLVSSNQQGKSDACESVGDLPMLEEDYHGSTCNAVVKLLP